MNLAVTFASMMGQGLLGSKVMRALPAIARTAERLTLRGMSRVYQDAAKRGAGELVGRQLGDMRAVSRTARREAFRDYRRVISSYREQASKVDHFIAKSNHPAAKLNRVAGRLFGPGPNGRPQALSSHIKNHIVNDLATMPIMYGMYRHERSQYPEMENTNFASYYAQTLPISIGFMGTLQAFRSAGSRHINQRIVKHLRHTGMGTSLVRGALAFQHKTITQMENIAAKARYVRRESTRDTLPEDLLSVRGLKEFGANFARASAKALRGSKITKDTDMDLIRTSVNTLINQGVDTEKAMEIGYGFSNSITRNKAKLHEWIDTITSPGAATYNLRNLSVGRGKDAGLMTNVISDRGHLLFEGKVYKTFSPSKFVDNMVTNLMDRHVNIGPGSTLRVGRVITAAFKPFTSDFSKSIGSTVIGTGLSDSGLKTGGVIAAVTNRIALGMGAGTKAIGHEEQTSVVKQTLGELFGSSDHSPSDRESIGEQIFAHMLASSKSGNKESFGPYLFRNMVDDMLPTSSGDLFHVDADGILSMIPKGSNTSFKMVGAGKFTHFTKEGKSVQAEAMNRMSGGIKTNYTHLKSAEDRAIEAINRRQRPEISFLHHMQDRYELGGSGVRSVVDYISGFFGKFFDSTSPHNLFHNKNLGTTIAGLKAATIDTADSFARSFNTRVSHAQERLFRFISRKGSKYDELVRALDGFYVEYGENNRTTLKAMSLSTAHDRQDAINRLDLFSSVMKSKDIDNTAQETLGSIRTALLEPGSDVKTVLDTVNYDMGVTFGEKYESMLFNIFLRSNNAPEQAIDVATSTAAKWIPSSKMTNLQTWKTIMQTSASGDKYLQADSRTVERLESALSNYRKEVVDILENNIPATTDIGKMIEGKHWWMGTGGQMERYRYHRHSTSTLYAVPEHGVFNPGLKRINYLDADNIERNAEVMTNAVNSASVLSFASFNTANKVMGLVGLGIDKYRSTEQIIGGLVTKRVLPLAAAGVAYTVADSFLDHSPLFEGSPLDEGLTVFGANIYAKAKIASAGILDATGISEASKYLEDLMPGVINSPLSGILRGPVPLMAGPAYGFMKGGMRGAVTGGIIGSSVSLLLGGFGLSAFDDWDISKNRAEVISELKGETEVKISTGRFWELSSSSFWGNKTSYYRPHMYHLLKSDYTDSPNFKTSLVDEIASYVDPSVYSRMHYWSRPSLEHPGMLSNIPFIGPMIQLPGTTAHQEYWDKTGSSSFLGELAQTRDLIRNGPDAPFADQLGLASGMGGSSNMINSLMPNPRSSSSIESRMSDTLYNMKELAGLRGFLTEQAQQALTGETQMYSEVPVIEAPNIGSIGRSFWGLELGGGAGLTEPIRRIFPRKTAEIQYFNPTVNLMPSWLPGKEYFMDFRKGDPYSKVQMGEVRLPGESYEAVKDVRHTFPGNSDLLGLDIDSAIQSYAGNPEYLISRYRAIDTIENTKERIIEGIRAEGALQHEKSVMYDPAADLSAQADILVRSAETNLVTPVKFAPYLQDQGGFLAGSASSLNAYLVLSGYKSGKLVGITKEGETTETVVVADEVRYRQDLEADLQARERAMGELIRRRENGLSVASGSSYSRIDRLRILGDVAYYSDEYRTELAIVKARIKAGKEPAEAEEIVARVEAQVDKLKNNRDFMPERFLSSFSSPLTEQAAHQQKYVTENYSAPERAIGGAWEYLSTMRNPLIRKLIGNRTALQAYEEDVVYGKAFKIWQEPIDSYIKPFANLQMQETDPLQSAMSGATAGFIFGGGFGAVAGGAGSALWAMTGAQNMEGFIPEETRIKREIMAAADLAEEQRYSMLHQMTGSEEYNFRMRNTISNALRTNQVVTQGRLKSLSNKPEREYINGIMNNLNSGNLDRVREILPENTAALVDQAMGVHNDVNPEQYAGDFTVAPGDVTNITQPIEDIVVRTFEREGLSAKDVGLGWHKTMARMAALERMGMNIPAMESRNKLETISNTKQYIDPTQIKKTLNRVLQGEVSTIMVTNNDGPLEVVIEVI